MSTAPSPRRPLGGDRIVALLVVMLSLPTIAWLVATDDAPAAALTAADATSASSGAAAATPARQGGGPTTMSDGADHDAMHDEMAEDVDHDAMHEQVHGDDDHQPMHPEMHADGDTTADTDTDTDAGTDASGPTEADATTVVRMNEFSFDMPTTYRAGRHTFEVVNDGAAPHEFALGAVGDHHSHVGQTEWLDGGETATLTVDLEPGTYEVGCHVPGHYEAGMKATITVTG